jgi:hypothetical protein
MQKPRTRPPIDPLEGVFTPVQGDLFLEAISDPLISTLSPPLLPGLGISNGFIALYKGDFKEAGMSFSTAALRLLSHQPPRASAAHYLNAEVRQWYAGGDREIQAALGPDGVFAHLSVHERSHLAVIMRNSLLGEARGMMQNPEEVAGLVSRDVAKYGAGGRTYTNLYKKYFFSPGWESLPENVNADQACRRIIEGAGRTNSEYNARFGISQ